MIKQNGQMKGSGAIMESCICGKMPKIIEDVRVVNSWRYKTIIICIDRSKVDGHVIRIEGEGCCPVEATQRAKSQWSRKIRIMKEFGVTIKHLEGQRVKIDEATKLV